MSDGLGLLSECLTFAERRNVGFCVPSRSLALLPRKRRCLYNENYAVMVGNTYRPPNYQRVQLSSDQENIPWYVNGIYAPRKFVPLK